MEGMIESMAPLYRAFNVHLVLIEPGAILTEFLNNAAVKPSSDPELQKYFDALRQVYAVIFSGTDKGAQTGLQVAEYVLQAGLEVDPPLRIQTNQTPTYKALIASKLTDPTGRVAVETSTKRFFGSLSNQSTL